MSWSIRFIGTTTKVVEALKANSEKLTGTSKQEYENALPHLIGLVEQNFDDAREAVVDISANGHGYAVDGTLKQSNCGVKIERLYAEVL